MVSNDFFPLLGKLENYPDSIRRSRGRVLSRVRCPSQHSYPSDIAEFVRREKHHSLFCYFYDSEPLPSAFAS